MISTHNLISFLLHIKNVNSDDVDEKAAFHQELHCLPK